MQVQLNINFIESIKAILGEDTEYLLFNPHNAKRLMQSIDNIEKNKDKLIHKSLEDLGIN